MNSLAWDTLLEHALEDRLSPGEVVQFSSSLREDTEKVDDYISQMFAHEMIVKHPESLQFLPCAEKGRMNTPFSLRMRKSTQCAAWNMPFRRKRGAIAAAAGIALLIGGAVALFFLSREEARPLPATAFALSRTEDRKPDSDSRVETGRETVAKGQRGKGAPAESDRRKAEDRYPIGNGQGKEREIAELSRRTIPQTKLSGAIAAERGNEMKTSQLAATVTAAALSALPAVKAVASAAVSAGSSLPHYIDTRDGAAEESMPHYIEARFPVDASSNGVRKSVINTAKPLGTVIMLI